MLIAAGPFDPYTAVKYVKVQGVSWPPSTVPKNGDLQSLGVEMRSRRRGHAIVIGESGRPATVVGIHDFLKFFLESQIAELLKGRSILDATRSDVVRVEEGEPQRNAVQIMINRHIRRIFVNSDLILSERSIAKWMSNSKTFESLQTNPRHWDQVKVGDLSKFMQKPERVEKDAELLKAMQSMLTSNSFCLVVEDASKIVTPQNVTLDLL